MDPTDRTPPPTTDPLAALSLLGEDDVFAARQLVRTCADELGLDRLDAVRLATAVSELGRELVRRGGGSLDVRLAADGVGVDLTAVVDPAWAAFTATVGRLVDELTVTGPRVRLLKRFSSPAVLTRDDVTLLRHRLRAATPFTPAEEMRGQNQELISALEEVRRQKAELEEVNRELEETNRGVMALYQELSAELDRTNQGVVALYAEIEDKSEQLREANEARSRFMRSISHELRTPANSVVGLARLLADPAGAPLSAEQLEQVEFIRASAQDLLRLVDELMDLSRAESGALQPTLARIDVGALLEELRGPVESLLRPGVRLVVGVRPGTALVTDVDLLRHVLRNLLSNAAKFTTSGTVEVHCTTDAGTVSLTVRDSGVGISPEELPRIFEEFYQAKTPLHASAKGTGLGLPFAQRVAQALGGRIEVESEIGTGSTFTLVLPDADRPESLPEVRA